MLSEFLEDSFLLPVPSGMHRTCEALVEVFKSLASAFINGTKDGLLLFVLEIALDICILKWLKRLKGRCNVCLVDVLGQGESIDTRRG